MKTVATQERTAAPTLIVKGFKGDVESGYAVIITKYPVMAVVVSV